MAAELDAAPSAATAQLAGDGHAPKAPERACLAQAGARLVGRTVEWDRLQRIWHELQDGGSALVALQGAGGFGKTRPSQELVDWSAQQPIYVATATCYAAESALEYGPVAACCVSGRILPLRRIYFGVRILGLNRSRTIRPPIHAKLH